MHLCRGDAEKEGEMEASQHLLCTTLCLFYPPLCQSPLQCVILASCPLSR